MKKEIKKCQFCRFCERQNGAMICKSSLSPNFGQVMYLDETCEVWSGKFKHKKDKGVAKPIPKEVWKEVEESLKKK